MSLNWTEWKWPQLSWKSKGRSESSEKQMSDLRTDDNPRTESKELSRTGHWVLISSLCVHIGAWLCGWIWVCVRCMCMCVHVHVQDNAEIRKQLSRVHSHLPLCWRCLSYFCLCTANTTLAGWLVSSWLSSIHLHLASHLQIGMMGLHITAPPHLPLTWL